MGWTVPRLPSHITPTQVTAALAALGLTPEAVRAVHIQPAVVVVDTWLIGADGQTVQHLGRARSEPVVIPRR